jgi:hypothetical protein
MKCVAFITFELTHMVLLQQDRSISLLQNPHNGYSSDPLWMLFNDDDGDEGRRRPRSRC